MFNLIYPFNFLSFYNQYIFDQFLIIYFFRKHEIFAVHNYQQLSESNKHLCYIAVMWKIAFCLLILKAIKLNKRNNTSVSSTNEMKTRQFNSCSTKA